LKKRINIETGFFRNLSRAAFDGLNEYYDAMETQLKRMAKEDKKKKENDVAKLKLNDKEKRYSEWDLAMQDHDATYNMLFKNFLRYSFIVLAGLVLEDWMYKLCLAAKDLKGASGPVPALGRDILKNYKKYLENIGVKVDDKYWQSIWDFVKVRNCIAHNSGKVGRSRRYENHLRNMAKRRLGVSIGYDTTDEEIQPLYLEGDMLVIEPEYCEALVRDIKQLFESLCEAVSLHELRWDV
jgi:hypothetical protein